MQKILKNLIDPENFLPKKKKKRFPTKTIIVLLIVVAICCLIGKCARDHKNDSRTLTEMLDENDFAAANKYVAKHQYKYHHEIARYYLPDALKTLKAEATYLMDQDDSDAETLFMLCINDVAGNIGIGQPVTGTYKESDTETDGIIDEITPYNSCLISIIREAVIKNKPEFANKVFKMMKQNYKCDKQIIQSGTWSDDCTYEYTEDNSQIEEAKSLLSELN